MLQPRLPSHYSRGGGVPGPLLPFSLPLGPHPGFSTGHGREGERGGGGVGVCTVPRAVAECDHVQVRGDLALQVQGRRARRPEACSRPRRRPFWDNGTRGQVREEEVRGPLPDDRCASGVEDPRAWAVPARYGGGSGPHRFIRRREGERDATQTSEECRRDAIRIQIRWTMLAHFREGVIHLPQRAACSHKWSTCSFLIKHCAIGLHTIINACAPKGDTLSTTTPSQPEEKFDFSVRGQVTPPLRPAPPVGPGPTTQGPVPLTVRDQRRRRCSWWWCGSIVQTVSKRGTWGRGV